jgi:hypothetical protein
MPIFDPCSTFFLAFRETASFTFQEFLLKLHSLALLILYAAKRNKLENQSRRTSPQNASEMGAINIVGPT